MVVTPNRWPHVHHLTVVNVRHAWLCSTTAKGYKRREEAKRAESEISDRIGFIRFLQSRKQTFENGTLCEIQRTFVVFC